MARGRTPDDGGSRTGWLRSNLTGQILVAMVLGLTVGMLLRAAPEATWIHEYIVDGALLVVGKIFVATLKMLVVPLVFVSLVCGVFGLEDIGKLGRMGGASLGLYLLTTAAAVTLALTAAQIVNPGAGFNLPTDVNFTAQEAPSLSEVLIALVPSNPIKAAAEGNMLQIIVFALLFGVGVAMAKDKRRSHVRALFEELNRVIMRMITLLMHVAPYGVFALLARVGAKQGFDAIAPLAAYFFTVVGVLILHASTTYALLLTTLARRSPWDFLQKMRSVMMFAFSTASSNATIPVTLRAVTERLGVPRAVASFTVPLGATINMDGTAVMQGVATVFIAQAYNIPMTMSGYMMVVLTATLASIGTAGVPGVGLITLAMVLRQVGLPVEGIALIMGVDRLLDMLRTAINVLGDATVSCVVGRLDSGAPESSDAAPAQAA